eukprot:m.1365536 g.1365536  ORF g.1365536 m.1365536 type:complete len:1069 (+) comp24947_c1_seq14:375-3581(+)
MATENATVIMDTNVGQPATPIEGAVRVQAVITGTEEESEKDLGSSVTHTESDVGEVPHTSSTEPSNDATVSERLSTTTNVLSKQTPAASIAEIPAPPPAVPAPPRKSSFTDVSQHTRKKLQELLKHQLIVPGPDQLTVDLCGMRFFANIDERGIVTTQDHPVPFKDLNELCIYCSGDKSIHYSNNHDGGDSAGWLLVRHKNRPLVTLMSTLANRKAQLKQSTATRVHFSIFDEVPIVRGTRERKRVEKFTYEPRVTKRGRSGVENGDTSAAGTDTSAPGKGKRPVGRPPKGGHPKVGAKQSTPALNVEEGAESDAEEDSEEDSEDADSDAEEDSEDDDDAENSDNNDDGHEVLTARASTGETFEERRRKGSNKKIFFSDDVPECDTGSNKTNPVWCIPCKRSLAGRSSFRRHLKDFHHMTSLKAKKIPVHFLRQSDGSPNSDVGVSKRGTKMAVTRGNTSESSGNTSESRGKKERVEKRKKGPRQHVPLELVASAAHKRKQDELYDSFLKFFFSDSGSSDSAPLPCKIDGDAVAVAGSDAGVAGGSAASVPTNITERIGTPTNNTIAATGEHEQTRVTTVVDIASDKEISRTVEVRARGMLRDDGSSAEACTDTVAPPTVAPDTSSAVRDGGSASTAAAAARDGSDDADDGSTAARATVLAPGTDPAEAEPGGLGGVTVGVIEVVDVSDGAHSRAVGAATSSATRAVARGGRDSAGGTTTGDITAMDTDASGSTVVSTSSATVPDTTSLALAAALQTTQPKRELRKYRPTKIGNALMSSKQLSPFTMINCQQFNDSRMKQPFRVQVTCSALFLMDLHSHLATTEVIGYLAGHWDATTKAITVTKAFPCRALEPGEGQGREQTVEMDPESEIEARSTIAARGMVVVGWYHSHPVFIAEPSIRDIENQSSYQSLFREGEDEPFVGFIIAPYETSAATTETSLVRCFWISATQKHCSHGSPMAPSFDMVDDDLDTDVCSDMRSLVQYYEVYTDRVLMSDMWRNRCSKKEKLAVSLQSRLSARLPANKREHVVKYVTEALALSDTLHENALAVQRARQGDDARAPAKKASKK